MNSGALLSLTAPKEYEQCFLFPSYYASSPQYHLNAARLFLAQRLRSHHHHHSPGGLRHLLIVLSFFTRRHNQDHTLDFVVYENNDEPQ